MQFLTRTDVGGTPPRRYGMANVVRPLWIPLVILKLRLMLPLNTMPLPDPECISQFRKTVFGTSRNKIPAVPLEIKKRQLAAKNVPRSTMTVHFVAGFMEVACEAFHSRSMPSRIKGESDQIRGADCFT